MSSEEDTELRDLLAQTLEANGCLPKLRAELRASIFLALDENVELQNSEPVLNKKLKTHLETQEGQNMFCLVREFLEYFGLQFTISVYEPESYMGTAYHYLGREQIVDDLKIPELKDNTLPLLLQILRIAQLKSTHQAQSIDINLSNIQNIGNENQTDLEICNNSSYNQDIEPTPLIDLDYANKHKDDLMNGSTECLDENHEGTKFNILNTTFDLSGPSINIVDKTQLLDEPKVSRSLVDITKAEDSLDGSSFSSDDRSENLASESDFSPPMLKDKSYSKLDNNIDKLKLSPQKAEKLKTKSNLSSLCELPPLQLNKSRNDTVLLPSLYSKDFKEKVVNQNIRDVEKLYDMEAMDNYEEDFVTDSEINSKSLSSIKNCSNEFQYSNSSKSNNSGSVHNSVDNVNCNTQLLKNKTETTESPRSVQSNDYFSRNSSESSSITSDDLNRNVDDILNSTSN